MATQVTLTDTDALTLEALQAPLLRSWTPELSLPDPQGPARRLHLPGETVRVYVDGDLYQETDADHLDLPGGLGVRGSLKVYDDAPAQGYSPRDEVRLTWSEVSGAERYRLERAPSGGSYATVVETMDTSYTDGPLEDDTYDYRVWAVDAQGDETDSAAVTVTVSSTPEPPSGLDWSFDDGTGTLTLTWDGSPSADVDVYRVRSSGGAETLDPTSAPVQEDSSTTYTQSFSSETGTYIVSVRAVDTDGNEEANIEQMVSIPFEGGSPAGRAVPPTLVSAEPVSGGKVEVGWHYEPVGEYLGPGVAEEARIYWNGGSGDVDHSSPHATVAMNGPENPQSYTWTSSALTDGNTYRFVVRIATATSPDGTETQNTDVVEAVPDSDVPGQPTLEAELI